MFWSLERARFPTLRGVCASRRGKLSSSFDGARACDGTDGPAWTDEAAMGWLGNLGRVLGAPLFGRGQSSKAILARPHLGLGDRWGTPLNGPSGCPRTPSLGGGVPASHPPAPEDRRLKYMFTHSPHLVHGDY